MHSLPRLHTDTLSRSFRDQRGCATSRRERSKPERVRTGIGSHQQTDTRPREPARPLWGWMRGAWGAWQLLADPCAWTGPAHPMQLLNMSHLDACRAANQGAGSCSDASSLGRSSQDSTSLFSLALGSALDCERCAVDGSRGFTCAGADDLGTNSTTNVPVPLCMQVEKRKTGGRKSLGQQQSSRCLVCVPTASSILGPCPFTA